MRKPGTKDEFEDLKVVAGREFEYEYPTKKVEEPVASADWKKRNGLGYSNCYY